MLTLLTLLPVLGALVVLVAGKNLARTTAFVFSLTQNISRRACSSISKKSRRIRISPPLMVRKNTPASAIWSSRSLISAVLISP